MHSSKDVLGDFHLFIYREIFSLKANGHFHHGIMKLFRGKVFALGLSFTQERRTYKLICHLKDIESIFKPSIQTLGLDSCFNSVLVLSLRVLSMACFM